MTRPLALRVAPGLLAVLMLACTGSELAPNGGDDGATGSDVDVTTDVPLDGSDGGPDVDVEDADGGPDGDAGDVDALDVGDDGGGPAAQWAVSSLGDSGALADIHAVSPDEVYAVGGTRVLRYDGRSWATFGDPAAGELRGVWSDGSVVVAVGDAGTIVRRAAGELTWTTDEVPTTSDLYAIDGRGPDDLWAVGDGTAVLHWDGTGWTEEHSGTTIALRGVWVDPDQTGPDGVLAAGTLGRIVRWGGAGWVPSQIAAGDVELHGIWGAPDGTLFAVGTDATVTMKAVGAPTWQGQPTNDPKSRDLLGVSGRSADDVVAVGRDGAIIEFDGDKWTVDSAKGPYYASAHLTAVTPLGGQWLAVAEGGGGVRYDGDEWIDMPTAPASELRALVADADGRLWGAGRAGLVMTETAAGWTVLPTDISADLHDIAVGPNGEIVAVGDGGTVVLGTETDGLAAVTLSVPVGLFGVAIDGARVVVCGKGGTLLEGTLGSETFSPRASGSLSDLRDAEVGGDGAVWLAGAFGTLLRWEGDDTPVAMTTGVGGTFNVLTSTSEGVVAAGDNGAIVVATPDGASLEHEEPGLFLYGVHASGETIYAAGWNGAILRGSLDGGFEAEVSGTNAVLEAIWFDASRAVAVGRQGSLLERLEAP